MMLPPMRRLLFPHNMTSLVWSREMQVRMLVMSQLYTAQPQQVQEKL